MAIAVEDPEEIERLRLYHEEHGYPPEVLAVSANILASIDAVFQKEPADG